MLRSRPSSVPGYGVAVERSTHLGYVSDLGVLPAGKLEAVKAFLTQRAQDALTGKNDAPPGWAYPLGMAYIQASGYKVHAVVGDATPSFSADEVAEVKRFAADNGLKLGGGASEAPGIMLAARMAFKELQNLDIAQTGYEKNAPTLELPTGGGITAQPGASTSSSSVTAGGGITHFLTSPLGITVGALALGGLGYAWWLVRQRRSRSGSRSAASFSPATTAAPRRLRAVAGFDAKVPHSKLRRRSKRSPPKARFTY